MATEIAVLEAVLKGCPISTHAMVLDNIGLDEEGKEIEILFGALAMQQWGITMKQQPRSTLRGHVFHLLG
uniref:Uncharacterized protein n=1 Tax=Candidatus Kentrum sp. LPFa TaxID=2126335 RepID=A0A450X9T9_9GAMM|nr:MAG: hypothetical protein BECKLPF1236C_GA0070990_1002911 [Candidatus Kentron sp. LPFa]